LGSTQRWFAMAGVFVMSTVAIAGFAMAIYAAWLFHDLPSGHEIADYSPATSTRVFAWDGTLIGEYAKERRIFVPYERIPPLLVKAFLAAEDRNFFNHSGIDMSGMGRAAIKDVMHVMKGRRLESGSTITQQVAKNVILSNSEQTIGRKLKEIILARRLEASLTKEQILELYLNYIFLGYRSNGVGSAAYNYFGKSIEDLSLSEMAFLAGLPRGPNNYNPVRAKDAAIARRNWVLSQMAQPGWITVAEANLAMRDDLVAQSGPKRAKYKDADYFISEVEKRSVNILGDRLYSGGYYVKTTLQPRLQSAARIALMDGLEAYDYRHGWRGAWGNISLVTGWQTRASEAYRALPMATKIPAERSNWQIGIITKATGAGAEVELLNGGTGQLQGPDLVWAMAGKGLKSGDLVYTEEKSSGIYHLRQVPQVNGALVAMDPWSGRVLAMVGGYSFSLSNFNRAMQAKRQPGSSIKPFIYAAALEKDYTPASIVMDAPISFTGANGEVWAPQNYERDYIGPASLRKGLERSRNTMTVRIAQTSGMKYIAEKVVSYGPYDRMEPVLAMALGAGETTPFNLTASYSAFPNGGRRIVPHMIELVQDRLGKIEYKADRRECPLSCNQGFDGLSSPQIVAEGQQVMDPITAYQITSFLEGVVQRGTAVRALALARPVAGKTGTTNAFRSAWFVGFTTDIVVGVFVGFDDNQSLGKGETGSNAALPIFVDFIDQIGSELPKKPFTKPKDAVYVTVRGIVEAFKPGTEPKAVMEVDLTAVPGPKPYEGQWRDAPVLEVEPLVSLPAPLSD
jgi:penicillin-binding protein 1A